MSNKDSKYQKFVELSWRLLEHKCRYYMFSKPSIQDFEFDQLEAEYRKLAEELGELPTASDMVDFDTTRPSCMRVHEKISKEFLPKKQNKRRIKKPLIK